VSNVGAGNSISLTAPSVTGYNFVAWTGVTGTVSGNGISFSMPAADVTAIATYQLPSYNLNVQSTPITGVAITGSNAGTTNYVATWLPVRP